MNIDDLLKIPTKTTKSKEQNALSLAKKYIRIMERIWTKQVSNQLNVKFNENYYMYLFDQVTVQWLLYLQDKINLFDLQESFDKMYNFIKSLNRGGKK